ncbi:unnamed protein product [Aphanomyces euteiches]
MFGQLALQLTTGIPAGSQFTNLLKQLRWVPFHPPLGKFVGCFERTTHPKSCRHPCRLWSFSILPSIMRITFPLLFAVAAFAFGQEQPNELLAEDSRALLAAGRRPRHFGGFRSFGRGFHRGGGGGGMAGPPGPPSEGGGESDVAADIPGGRPPFGRGFPGGPPMGHFGGHFGGRFGGGPPGGAGAPQDGGQADEAGRLLTAMGRRGGGRRGGGRRGGGRRGGGRRGGGRRGGGRRGRHL